MTFVPVPATPTPGPVTPVTPPAPAPAAASGVATAAATIAVAPGQALPVTPGQVLAARVVAIEAGMIELSLAGGRVTAASDLPLEPGQTLRMVVADAGQERVTLRIDPGAGGATSPAAAPGGGATSAAAASPADALAGAGVPHAAATALLSAMADLGGDLPTGAAAQSLAARAAAAGVQTPAQAAAFARLEAAGLPATQASVGGLAQLIDGAPLGRALATVIDAALARVAQGAEAPQVPAAPAATVALVADAPDAPRAPAPPVLSAAAGAVTDMAGEASPEVQLDPGVRPNGPLAAAATPAPAPAPAAPAPAAGPAASPLVAAAAGDAPPLEPLVASLAALAKEIEAGVTDGRGTALRHALADLGTGLEARLASGAGAERAPVRSLLLSLASHPAADAPLARAAAGLADAIAAQPLAAPAMAATAAATGAGASATGAAPLSDPTQTGAYLQVPLPGGGTAEVRVAPDGGRGGADGDGATGPRRLAFLLHLSALGPVMIDASAGAGSVEATVRVGSDDVRVFLDTQAADLAEALRRSTPTASVRVERMSGPAPERLLAPPPPSGLDVSA